MTSSSRPSPQDIEAWTRLYNAHLACPASSAKEYTSAVQAFRAHIPPQHQQYYDALANKLRAEFHATQASQRQAKLHCLLVQTPPFRVSDEDRLYLASSRGKIARYRQLQTYTKQFARKNSVGVHPFFSALKRVLEIQALDRKRRCIEWALDDAVLMEAGGEEFMRATVWILKGVLHFEEFKPQDQNPFLEDSEDDKQPLSHTATDALRIWTVAPHLTNSECMSLARCIPKHVLPRHRATCGGRPVRYEELLQLETADQEQQSFLNLPTGFLRYSHRARSADIIGTWWGRLVDLVVSICIR